LPEPDAARTLRSLYDTSLGPWLAAQDARVRATRRNRWLVLFGGLGLAAAIVVWIIRHGVDNEYPPMAAFALAVGSIGFFWVMTDVLADEVRDHAMAQIATFLGLKFERSVKGFDVERFELLGLAHCSSVTGGDRLYGVIGGLTADMVTAKLRDKSTSGAGSSAQTRITERFTGLLMRVDDPVPPTARFRLAPPVALSPKGMLRGVSITLRGTSGASRADARAVLAATLEEAPVTPTGDATFDARFELHAAATDVSVALARLDDGTRAALLDIADLFGGGPVAVGFDAGGILFAFVTKQRFEIGRLRPPMAQFERVEHLADQMGVLAKITTRIGSARDGGASATAGPSPHPETP
jgi:hypothetical protein